MARFYWLERHSRGLAKRVKKIPGGTAPRAEVRQALVDSAEAMAEMFAEAERAGVVKGIKLTPVAYLGYTMAHEGHHRGQSYLAAQDREAAARPRHRL